VSVLDNGTHLVVTVPPDASSGPITVTANGGTVTSRDSFEVTAQMTGPPIARPHIWSFSPTRGKVGAKVMIRGDNLGGAVWVKFGGVKATYTILKTTLIIAHVPKKAHTGQILIKTSTGMATKSLRFTVLGSPGT